jgi:hypothetical protein
VTAAAGVSWEAVAHVLEHEDDVSDAELAVRLMCGPGFIAGVRADLRMPPFPEPSKPGGRHE